MGWIVCSWVMASTNEHPARIRSLEGDATVRHFGQSVGREVSINYPLWEGDRLSLGRGARLELSFHDGSLIRLGPGTRLTLRKMTHRQVQIHLIAGGLALETEFPERFELFTKSTYLYPDQKGLYYLAVKGVAEVARVLEGRARVAYRGKAWNLLAGEGLFEGEVQAGRFADSELSLIGWRPAPEDGSLFSTGDSPAEESLPYSSAVELSRYGNWGSLGGYGWVWWPKVSSKWLPYRDGRWVHHPRKGSIWISQARWGWLPDHYGDWVFVPQYSRWCWVPGDLGQWLPGRSGPWFRNRLPTGGRRVVQHATPISVTTRTTPRDRLTPVRHSVPRHSLNWASFPSRQASRPAGLEAPVRPLTAPVRRLEPSLSHARVHASPKRQAPARRLTAPVQPLNRSPGLSQVRGRSSSLRSSVTRARRSAPSRISRIGRGSGR